MVGGSLDAPPAALCIVLSTKESCLLVGRLILWVSEASGSTFMLGQIKKPKLIRCGKKLKLVNIDLLFFSYSVSSGYKCYF